MISLKAKITYWIITATIVVAVAANSIFHEEAFDDEDFDGEEELSANATRQGKIREYFIYQAGELCRKLSKNHQRCYRVCKMGMKSVTFRKIS